jgi:hypothetical protein
MAPDEEEQRFTLTLLPLASLQAAMILLRSAAEAAQDLVAAGVNARDAGPEILSVLGEQIYGHVDGLRPGESPYRWPGAPAQQLTPNPGFSQDATNLPPEKIYAASRLARSAWDTLRRSLREAELPFDLSGASLRELTETVRAVNDLVQTVTSNPSAQQMAMAFLNRQGARGAGPMASDDPAPAAQEPARQAQPAPAAPDPQANIYHEIPLRRRASPVASPPPVTTMPAAEPTPPALPDRREIPLRRRGPANAGPRSFSRAPTPLSGSGDADVDDGR